MCGIFGVLADSSSTLTADAIKSVVNRLLILSESRGKEAAGVAFLQDNTIKVFKQAISASEMIRTREYRQLLDEAVDGVDEKRKRRVAIIGHSRLVTNGAQNTRSNNQPVIAGKMTGIHNGIICNTQELWDKFSTLQRHTDVDTELLFCLIRHFCQQTGSLVEAVKLAYGQIQGVANIAVFLEDFNQLLLATNNGSLYLCTGESDSACIFASEEYALKMLVEKESLDRRLGKCRIAQLPPGHGYLVDLDGIRLQPFALDPKSDERLPDEKNSVHYRIEEIFGADSPKIHISSLASNICKTPPSWVIEEYERNKTAISRLRRCTKCALPETFPFITLDADGVCIECRRHAHAPKQQYLGPEALEAAVAPYRSKDGRPDCLIPISGGRDSCYTLHYFKKILKMNPMAYTYDWGMVTDLARRNISRMCGKLGVEHILVSADITRKRSNILKNVKAWLSKPDLGIIPLFMAGDKAFFYYAHQLRKQTGINLIVFAMNALEDTDFKTGFCGIRPVEEVGRNGGCDTPGSKGSLKLISYFAKSFLTNPRYLNSSLLDTMAAYFIYYLMPIHQHYMLFDNYIKWDEETVVGTIIKEYDWETSPDTPTTWRIGDGTVPFYNYIYYTVAGFSENDTFRSNQVRGGMITREEALKFLDEENYPRFESMSWYCNTIGVDLEKALRIIHAIPKHYPVD